MDTKHLQAEIKMADGAAELGVDLAEGEFLAIISDPTLDRDGEIVDAGAFEPLPSKITIDIDHGMSVRSTVGSGRPFYSGDRLMIRGRFASTDLAKDTRTLVTEGHVDRMSVAYRRAQVRDVDGVPHIFKAELLNVAIVPIPANPAAAILAAKAADMLAPPSEAEDREALTRAIEQFVKDYEAADAPTEVLVLDRPDSVPADKANDWSTAVTEFAKTWTPDGSDETSTGEAPEGAASDDQAADKAADVEAAARQRRRAVERQKAALALASTPTT